MEHKQETFNWSEWIFQERTRRGWTQQELADRIRVSSLTIIRWERNLQTPRPSSKIALTHLFESEHDIVISDSCEETVFSSFSRPHILDPAVPPPLTLATGLIGREDIMRRLKPWIHVHNHYDRANRYFQESLDIAYQIEQWLQKHDSAEIENPCAVL
jgi:transcriptional regulator with XRE-family HTH domain